jgi:two-component system, NtrC family, response regulator GlrR
MYRGKFPQCFGHPQLLMAKASLEISISLFGEILLERLGGHSPGSQGVATLVGRAPSFVKAIEQLSDIARSEAPVLISGETGTGKELVAQAIHSLSERASGPFIAVNCGLLQNSLLEDVLFGHERGAFTNAYKHRPGFFALAENGTILLDEIDFLSLNGQVALLRVLQDKRYHLIGGTIEKEANVRILSATNADLPDSVRKGKFRSDLYHRLNVFSIHLPPLRERREDVPILISHFLKKHRPPEQREFRLAREAYTALSNYHWPGNVRELENAVIRAVYLTKDEVINSEHLGVPINPGPEQLRPMQIEKKEAIEAFERDYLIRLMRKTNGNISQAARIAHKDRGDLYKLLRKYRIKPRTFHSN